MYFGVCIMCSPPRKKPHVYSYLLDGCGGMGNYAQPRVNKVET
jgi:hypothetical protein